MQEGCKRHQNEKHLLVIKRLPTGGSTRQCHAHNYACKVWGSLGDARGAMLKKTSVVMPRDSETFLKKENRDDVSRKMQSVPTCPGAWRPSLWRNGSSPSPHPLLRVPHPISKSIICVCEAEEAHHLSTAPPPFPSFPLAATAPPASPPLLACCCCCRCTSNLSSSSSSGGGGSGSGL